MITYHILELYNLAYYCIYSNHIYTYAHLLNQQIKGYEPASVIRDLEAHTSTLKVIPGFTSFPGNLESIVIVKLHPMTSAIILRLLYSQWTFTNSLFQGALPLCIWFNMEILMTKMKISLAFPSLLHNPSGNPVTPFHVVTHLPSSLTSPIPS